MSRKDLLKGLSKEQIKKINSCKNHEEILALAKEEGIELTNEQLSAISGGGACAESYKCQACGYEGPHKYVNTQDHSKVYCGNCGAYIADEAFEK